MFNQKSFRPFAFFALTLLVGCVGASLAGDRQKTPALSQTATVRAVEVPEWMSQVLPYAGYGSMHILDNGDVIMEFSGELRPSSDDDVELGAMPSLEIVGFRLDTEGLRLVRDGNAFTLDRSGAQLKAKGVLADQVNLITFRNPFLPARDTARYALISLAGHLVADFDKSGARLELAITEVGNAPRFFEASVIFAAPGQAPAGQDGEGAKGGGVFEEPVGHELMALTGCDASCTQGTCNISCTGRKLGAKCWCDDDGLPNCRCVKH